MAEIICSPIHFAKALKTAEHYVVVRQTVAGFVVELRIGVQSFVLTPQPYNDRRDAKHFCELARKGIAKMLATECKKLR